MGVHPTKPRYTCDNCYHDKHYNEAICRTCRPLDKPTMKPVHWQPIEELEKWNPTREER